MLQFCDPLSRLMAAVSRRAPVMFCPARPTLGPVGCGTGRSLGWPDVRRLCQPDELRQERRTGGVALRIIPSDGLRSKRADPQCGAETTLRVTQRSDSERRADRADLQRVARLHAHRAPARRRRRDLWWERGA